MYRGVHLKDLILLHTALPDWVDDIYVNFRKMVQLSMIFTELMQVQNATLPIEPNMDLVNTVRVRSSVIHGLIYFRNAKRAAQSYTSDVHFQECLWRKPFK